MTEPTVSLRAARSALPVEAEHLPGCEHTHAPQWICACPRPRFAAQPAPPTEATEARAELAAQAHEWRRREVQAIGGAISDRSWPGVELAYNVLRDKMDRAGCWNAPAEATPPHDGLREIWTGCDNRHCGDSSRCHDCAGCTANAAALTSEVQPAGLGYAPAFKLGDRVEKVGGASWRGVIVGTYRTGLTPEGYAVESEREPGSVQIYPVKALRTLASGESA